MIIVIYSVLAVAFSMLFIAYFGTAKKVYTEGLERTGLYWDLFFYVPVVFFLIADSFVKAIQALKRKKSLRYFFLPFAAADLLLALWEGVYIASRTIRLSRRASNIFISPTISDPVGWLWKYAAINIFAAAAFFLIGYYLKRRKKI